jgi:predicted PurR-regulated permease PerM
VLPPYFAFTYAAFFAVALYPAVGWVQRRMLGGRWRPLATLVVFLLVVLTLAGVVTAFAVPLTQEGTLWVPETRCARVEQGFCRCGRAGMIGGWGCVWGI